MSESGEKTALPRGGRPKCTRLAETDIEIGLRPGAADLGILGKFALSAQCCYIFRGVLHLKSKNKN